MLQLNTDYMRLSNDLPPFQNFKIVCKLIKIVGIQFNSLVCLFSILEKVLIKTPFFFQYFENL